MISLTSLLFPFSAQINITAKSGENAILPCQDPGNDFTAVKWRRPDQEDESIFLERDGHVVEYDQHPSVKNWTVLQKKDGNVSLILKNVTTNDTGRLIPPPSHLKMILKVNFLFPQTNFTDSTHFHRTIINIKSV